MTEKSDIYAYSARFMIKPDNIITLEKMIESHFQKKITKEKECLLNNEKTLHYYRFEEFHQTVIDIITNNNHFIKALCEEGL
ncbi:hypothetical protein PT300_11265 [Enterobacteriaceae bacterium ESL0689]|nr:hypothetical protein [Enterobacteriaceae bacterium ESL0689]